MMRSYADALRAGQADAAQPGRHDPRSVCGGNELGGCWDFEVDSSLAYGSRADGTFGIDHDALYDRIQAQGKKPDTEQSPPDLTNIFAGLSSRGLAKTRAQKAADAHPRAEQIAYVQDNFMDILTELEDSGLVKINCD